MARNFDTVKIKPHYHHGDLRAALIEAAEGLLAECGPDRFSLREAARRAGVSPAAPKHHFHDARGLLTAIAVRAFDDLAARLEVAAEGSDDRIECIRAQGRAYVRFALDERARFDLMWRTALLDGEDAELDRAGRRAFAALDRLVRGKDAVALARDDPATAPSVACWSMVHGFARLALDGSFGLDEKAAARAAEALLPLVLDRLSL
jgi:AcrR family transcriptional regulator